MSFARLRNNVSATTRGIFGNRGRRHRGFVFLGPSPIRRSPSYRLTVSRLRRGRDRVLTLGRSSDSASATIGTSQIKILERQWVERFVRSRRQSA